MLLASQNRELSRRVSGCSTGACGGARASWVVLKNRQHEHHASSSPGKGANRAWGLVCTLLLLLWLSVGAALAVPPGTVIDNTAQANFNALGSNLIQNSNTVSLITTWRRTPCGIQLLQYAPLLAGAQSIQVPLTAYDPDGVAGGPTQQIASVYPAGSTTPIDLSQPVPMAAANIYHQGEPVFVQVTDADQNIDPLAAETIWVLVTVSSLGESELLLLTETGPDTGAFVGYIQSGSLAGVQPFNGLLNVVEGAQVSAQYTDPADASDVAVVSVLVDPYGLVFDSGTGQPVNNVRLTLVETNTGQPATVYGDDGISSFPATVASGGTHTDSSGKVYAFTPGNYRFPFVAPGTYRLVIQPPAGYAAPSTVATAALQALPGAPFVIADPGSRGEDFILNPGPAVRMDIPVDPSGLGIWLRKTVNQDVAAVGDFLQYTLRVENVSENLLQGVLVMDRLPRGFRYRKGSVRMDGNKTADPQISSDGRGLTFTVGDMAAASAVELRYVAEVTAGTPNGEARNRATAVSTNGYGSNTAIAAVHIKEDLFRSENFIVGRVIADNCDDVETEQADGVKGVRIYLEDGTYVITDEQGMYHFEGVSSKTHVVQLDLESLPDHLQISDCEKNTRTAGTPFSRFVELQGGTLWRVDFHVTSKPAPAGQVGLKMHCDLKEQGNIAYETVVNVLGVPVSALRLTILLPEGAAYVPGSSLLGQTPIPDPQALGDALTYRLGDAAAGQTVNIHFSMRIKDQAEPGRFHTKALLTFDAPAQKNQRTQIIDTVLDYTAQKTLVERPPVFYEPIFESLSADLTPDDKQTLERVVAELKLIPIERIQIECALFEGHADNLPIRSGSNQVYADNQALSEARARNVARYLTQLLHLPEEKIVVIGKGDREPVADNGTSLGQAMNRRVEVKIDRSLVRLVEKIDFIKCEDHTRADTRGVKPGNESDNRLSEIEQAPEPSFDQKELDGLNPGFQWLMPLADFSPPIPSIKLAVQHAPAERIRLLLNGRQVSPLNYDGRKLNRAQTVAVSFWRGVDIETGDNHFTAVRLDSAGRELGRIERMVHYAGSPVNVTLLRPQSRLVANGKDAPVIVCRLTDKDGYPARLGMFGEFSVSPPYKAQPLEKKGIHDSIIRNLDEKPRYSVDRDGLVRIHLEPTTQAGHVVITVPLSNKDHEVRVWLQPELREWILVGLAEGTLGYNSASGNMENLDAAGQEEDYYRDGRVAFFAKGKVKGEWLVTAAYDSSRDPDDPNTRFFQTIDPDTYYTLYGDATTQNNEAPSIRKLYLKVEREQFYAMFGDYDTGLDVTELSKYSRRFNGIKSVYNGDRFGLNVFAADTDQAFVKDEIRGDGTSGLYHLSRASIVLNSEKVTIEARDRFHSERIVSSKTLMRHIDYNIDYDAGTLFFKTPIQSRDEQFNPIYIVVAYESEDTVDEAYTFGGRGSVKMLDGRVEVGATYVHEGPKNANADLGGVDARLDLGGGVEVKAEMAATRKEQASEEVEGKAYIVEVNKQSEKVDAKVYYREQAEGFGLGQQNGSEAETRKIGAEGAMRLSETWELGSEVMRQYNLATDAERDLGELRLKYNQPLYQLSTGMRQVEDRFEDGTVDRSTQVLAGVSWQFLDNRLKLHAAHEQSIVGNNGSVDYPTRTILGADYQINNSVILFAEHEMTWGQDEDTHSTRVGAKTSPWEGGQIGTSVGRQSAESSERLFNTLGLYQTWKVNANWQLDGGLDRTQTVARTDMKSFNTNVPTAAGAQEDFTAVSLGAGYRAEKWSWTGRIESRMAETQDKWGVISGIAGEVHKGLGLSAGLTWFATENDDHARETDADLRLSMALRPKNTRWIVFDRLDYKLEEKESRNSRSNARRIVNNLNANYKPAHRLQTAFQYGSKYVFDSFDGDSYTGYTDLTGLEVRYDLSETWDIGCQAGVLHSWNGGQMDYRTGVSLGYTIVKNTWISLGYNFTGFEDEDFSNADYTAQGPFIKFRVKFDQQSVREIVSWFDKQGR